MSEVIILVLERFDFFDGAFKLLREGVHDARELHVMAVELPQNIQVQVVNIFADALAERDEGVVDDAADQRCVAVGI